MLNEFNVIKVVYQHRRSSIYLATHRKYGSAQKVILKETKLDGCSLEDRRLAIQEAHLLSRNRHPNIIKLLEHFEEGESIFLVMEWAEFGDLSMAWKRSEGSAEDFTMAVMVVLIQLLLALRHLHQAHIIHRDIKTRNILCGQLIPGSPLLRIKLADFGIARIVRCTASMAKTMIGTPYYSSPEIFSGDYYDFKADVWSLGCVIYELLTGRRPFQSSEMRELSHKVRHCQYESLPKSIPFGLRDLVDSMLQLDPAIRPNASELLAHPFVKEYSHKLYDLLQSHSPQKQPSAKGYPKEFQAVYRNLAKGVGEREASKSVILLMAPELMGEFSGCEDYEALAYQAWSTKNQKAKSLSDTETIHGDDTEELTMTLRQIGGDRKSTTDSLDQDLSRIVKSRCLQDCVADLLPQIHENVTDMEEIITIYKVIKAEMANLSRGLPTEIEAKLKRILGEKRHEALRRHGGYQLVCRLVVVESRLEANNFMT